MDDQSALAWQLLCFNYTNEKPLPTEIPHQLEIVDYICRVTAPKLGHWDVDLLIVLLNVNLYILMQLQLPLKWRVERVFKEDPTVEHALPGKLWKLEQNGDGTHTHTPLQIS